MSSAQHWNGTLTPLAGAATYTGPRRSSGNSSGGAGWYNSDVFSDQACTVYVERSHDSGATWYPCNGTAGTASAAASSLLLRVPVTAGSYRTRVLNGATLQTSFCVSESFSDS